MNATRPSSRTMGAILLLAACSLRGASLVAQETEQYKGRSLAEALRMLQAGGLPIVFTSATVTPDLWVRVEPRSASARRQLDELLAPHGLSARDGPRGTIQIVRARPARMDSAEWTSAAATGTIEGRVVHAVTADPLADVVVQIDGMASNVRTDVAGRFLVRRVNAGTRVVRTSTTGYVPVTRAIQVTSGTTATVTMRLIPATSTHSEHVTVSRPWPYRQDPGVASETTLNRGQVSQLQGSLAEDPIRAVHAFPGVSAIDEFRSEFAVRGSGFRHVDLVIDGVSTHWLRHTAHGRGATGSLAMVAGQVLEQATLRAGPYPRRDGDRLGPQLELTLREGSRSQFGMRGVVGGSNATVLGEGPIGRSARGSWLGAIRQSYLEWPTERAESTRTVFGFSDVLAKLVYDVRPNQQVDFSVIGGMSKIDGDDNVAPSQFGDGTNRASVVNFGWRSTFGPSFVLRQRVYAVRQHFLNKDRTGRESHHGRSQDVVYRADIRRRISHGQLELGTQVTRSATRQVSASVEGDAFAGSSWLRSGYAHVTWTAMPRLTLSSGLRVTDSTLFARHRATTRWLLGEWVFRTGWALNLSSGISHQFPELHHALGRNGSMELRPERATHFDVGLEQRVSKSIRWHATVFNRMEADILRDPDNHPRLVGDAIAWPDRGRYRNVLDGMSRGLELLVDRHTANGLSGWAGYSYGKTRYADPTRGETFWSDFDQRHALNLFGVYRISNRTSLGATFRAGTSFPIPGYFTTRDGELFVASQRNRVRPPAYARLDVRADRRFEYLGRRLIVFAEVLNVLNRPNSGLANGSVNPSTGQAIGFTDALFTRRPSGGIVIEF